MATGTEIVEQAKHMVEALTGLTTDTVSSLTHEGDAWHVDLELVEMRRIPDSTDMLATYEMAIGDDGRLIRYQRSRRYLRGQAMEQETAGIGGRP